MQAFTSRKLRALEILAVLGIILHLILLFKIDEIGSTQLKPKISITTYVCQGPQCISSHRTEEQKEFRDSVPEKGRDEVEELKGMDV